MAAQRPSADADASHNFSLVPDAYLAQLNPGLKHAGQILHQLPEINSAVGGKVKQDLIIIKCVFGVNELHIQMMLFDFFLADFKGIPLLLLVPGLCRLILIRGHTDH